MIEGVIQEPEPCNGGKTQGSGCELDGYSVILISSKYYIKNRVNVNNINREIRRREKWAVFIEKKGFS